jgi:hypothetical protein
LAPINLSVRGFGKERVAGGAEKLGDGGLESFLDCVGGKILGQNVFGPVLIPVIGAERHEVQAFDIDGHEIDGSSRREMLIEDAGDGVGFNHLDLDNAVMVHAVTLFRQVGIESIQRGIIKNMKIQAGRFFRDADFQVDVPWPFGGKGSHASGHGIDVYPPPSAEVEIIRVGVAHRMMRADIDVKAVGLPFKNAGEDQVLPFLGKSVRQRARGANGPFSPAHDISEGRIHGY